ncbi:hypothetical protein AMJ44_10470 [candidate division WOR-1 bacterium DG_54_3]|uniref:Uncharacterized protein n=1 Tax=candidate division WOR-1 bacterium DG_54_3 TaxID=1703775 RepID=A0A0S7XSG3_UNCSA|nr:MAG: hypothetical protein AMJ44_10470 [candidate division WOR-1 bacterium DG_54_3]
MGNGGKTPIFFGDELSEEEKNGLIAKVQGLGESYVDVQYGEIGKFYKETGDLTTHEDQTIRGRQAIADYFNHLRDMKVAEVMFGLECAYAKELSHIKVRDLIESGIIEEGDLPPEVDPNDKVTHVAYVVVSYSFELGGREYNTPLPSFGLGFHIMGCWWL